MKYGWLKPTKIQAVKTSMKWWIERPNKSLLATARMGVWANGCNSIHPIRGPHQIGFPNEQIYVFLKKTCRGELAIFACHRVGLFSRSDGLFVNL